MDKYIPYEKLSKKEKRKLDTVKRTTWGSLNPVTRKPANSKAYNSKKAQSWKNAFPNSVLFLCLLQGAICLATHQNVRYTVKTLDRAYCSAHSRRTHMQREDLFALQKTIKDDPISYYMEASKKSPAAIGRAPVYAVSSS